VVHARPNLLDVDAEVPSQADRDQGEVAGMAQAEAERSAVRRGI
jgi:hypothetical protein